MYNIELLRTSLEYIENHLNANIKTEDVAKACFCSKSTLEKLFRCVNRITVHDYLVHRRMTVAARRIVEKPEEAILTIALTYGYSTHESFTRAFEHIWNCKPSEFRNMRFTELFPRLMVPLENGDDYMNERNNFNIDQLYDIFKERKECYFICCDIKGLVPINLISKKAGDIAIMQTINRMNEVASSEDIVFRIGGDEFCILTNSKEQSYAEIMAEKLREHNHEKFCFEDIEIPLKLYVVVTKFEKEGLNYNELFTELHTTIKNCK